MALVVAHVPSNAPVSGRVPACPTLESSSDIPNAASSIFPAASPGEMAGLVWSFGQRLFIMLISLINAAWSSSSGKPAPALPGRSLSSQWAAQPEPMECVWIHRDA